ncbi:probable methyltransferase PMT2 [Tanacetum coccineum]
MKMRGEDESPGGKKHEKPTKCKREESGDGDEVSTEEDKDGADGKENFHDTVPAFPVKAVDTTSGGDSFVGALLTKIVDDQSVLHDELKVVPDPATWSLLEENTFTEIMDKEVKRGCLIVCEDGSEELHFGWKSVVVLKSVTDASQDNEYIAREQMMVSGTGNESVYMLAHCWRTLNSSLCRASMSFTRRDNHEAQVQFALERGVLAVIGVLAGKYMMEVDRVLRPGGYWVLSGPLIKTAKLLSWDKISKKGEMAIWQKKINTESCRPAENTPEVEYFSTDPDDVW